MASSSRVFHPLLARFGIIALVPASVAMWAGGPLVALGTAGTLTAVELWRVRRLVVNGMPADLEFVPSRPAEHAWLDEDGFRGELTDLADLGFHPLADYSAEYRGAPDAFARLLVHPRHRLYAEVNQMRQGSVILPVATTLTSTMSHGWSVQTSSREAPAVLAAFMRAPRALWRTRPGMDAGALLDDHLTLRAELCENLDVDVEGDGTVEAYFDAQRTAHRARAEAVRHTNIVTGIALGVACERSPRAEWLGDYPSA